MGSSGYINLSRQAGLVRELSVIANNMANANTSGYKREGALFTEYVAAAGRAQSMSSNSADQSVSIGRLGAHFSAFESGDLRQTGAAFDLALGSDGFFRVQTPGGERLTRAGTFQTNDQGTLITPEGHAVLDNGGGEIQIPLEVKTLTIAPDGTISADGVELGQIGVVTADPLQLSRSGDNLWIANGQINPLEFPKIMQGFLEGSNVQPVQEIARMIEVQRHYDAGQKLLDMEHDRISKVITTLRQLT